MCLIQSTSPHRIMQVPDRVLMPFVVDRIKPPLSQNQSVGKQVELMGHDSELFPKV